MNAIITQPSVSYLVMTINAKANASKKHNKEIPREILNLIPDLDPESDDVYL